MISNWENMISSRIYVPPPTAESSGYLAIVVTNKTNSGFLFHSKWTHNKIFEGLRQSYNNLSLFLNSYSFTWFINFYKWSSSFNA